MVLELDDRGKFFTDVVKKEAILAHIQTLTHRMRGYVHVPQGERLSDAINRAEQFIAVTQAEIYNTAGEVIQSSNFLIVNREHIVWLAPVKTENGDEPE
jgi:hypothetical protein